ncbi:alpha/beta fold hydrolase [Microvirga solisilvae]|uniref:alpha/beta fold hydrolase n=1 Tax=Microvirga solisilvae TaxID=2919498 RepID=UPI001FAEB8BE|nr:alpha/beta hydrolase [Microvirga solisilvae]
MTSFPSDDQSSALPEVSSGKHAVNGITLHDVQAGPEHAPLAILLHGFGDFWWGWRRQIGPLTSAGFRVVAPDQRGYNLSEKPIGLKAYDLDTLAADIVELAAAYNRRKFVLIGHDFGGLVGWWIASRHPQHVERFIAINSFHPQALVPYWRKSPTQFLRNLYMAFYQIPWLPEALFRMKNFELMRQLYLRSGRPGTFSKADLDRYQSTWSKPGALTGMINWYRAMRRKPHIENLRITVPTLVIWGLKDFYLEKGLAEASLALCDDGRATWIENGTHFVHIEEPEAVNRAMLDFLKA